MASAARKGDRQSCPRVGPGNQRHVGGQVKGGAASVFIGGQEAAHAGSKFGCQAGSEGEIVVGSDSVFVEGKSLARVGDATSHGGKVKSGCDSVLVDEL
jgi:uncharacterized Zn-binding protein involved in type VI secretion